MIEIKANEKYNASKIDERHRDHALYTAFAPLEEPHIALALVVENAGFGAGAARADRAPRVRLSCCRGQYPSEADIAATQPGQSTAPDRHAAADRRRCRCRARRSTARRHASTAGLAAPVPVAASAPTPRRPRVAPRDRVAAATSCR